MTLNILFAGNPSIWGDYETPLRDAFAEAGLDVSLATDMAPEVVDYMVFSPAGTVEDFTPYTKLKGILNLWAGVEQVVGNPTINAPLCRMVDRGLSEGMVEWVVGHVMRHHLNIDLFLNNQDGVWRETANAPLARDRTIGILGIGALGLACGEALAALNFNVVGWSRSAKSHPVIDCAHGDTGLNRVLACSDQLVLLMPQTPDTTHMLNADRLARLPKGAVVINPGRGPLIDDDALLDALDSGHIAHATLDVFDVEPLPPEHRFWAHPGVTVTPHIASITRPITAARTIAQNIAGHQRGEPLRDQVDLSLGY